MPKKKSKRKSGYFLKILKSGIITNNPTFVQLLGMCPTLAVTTSVPNGIVMGLSTAFVLICSNFIISLLRKFIANKIRIAIFVVLVAGFVGVIDMLLKAYLPEFAVSLGIYIPLIVVNCIILARAESFAYKNTPIPSVLDGVATGIGFTLALTVISAVREVLGNGTLLGINITGENFSPALIMVFPAGGFLTLGFLVALTQFLSAKAEGRKK